MKAATKKLILGLTFLSLLILLPQKAISERTYAISEIYELLNNNPGSLKNKAITLKGYVLEYSMVRTLNPAVTRCANFYYLIDFDEEFIKKYDQIGYKEQRELLKTIPIILSGEPKDNIHPTQYGIYTGHFYDKEAMKCKDGYKRFVIIDKIEEIDIVWPMTAKSGVVTTGMVIANGKYINPPYSIKLENCKITINDILYEPYIPDKTIYRWVDRQRVNSFDSLINVLRQNRMIIFGGKRYEITRSRFDERDLELIGEILQSDKPKSYKKENLEKVLGVSLTDESFEEFLNH